jgi:hypothetical protein
LYVLESDIDSVDAIAAAYIEKLPLRAPDPASDAETLHGTSVTR